MNRVGLALGAALVMSSFALASLGREPIQTPAAEWRTFRGMWSATGERRTLATESGRVAAVVQLSGTVMITAGNGIGRGFLGEAIGYDDGVAQSGGRAVWTDEHGDRIYSTLTGEPVATGRRIAGTITGGSGRYAGITGDYALTWQYVLQADDTSIAGRAADLEGRFRLLGGAR